MNHFYDIVIRPFVEPFSGMYIEVLVKVKLITIYIFVMVIDKLMILFQISDDLTLVETAVALVDTPKMYWVGLFIVTSIDIFFGCIRALREPDVDWNWQVFERGAFKLLVYAGALIVTATATNMFPLIFGFFQYVVVAMITIREGASAMRNMGLTAMWHAFLETTKNSLPPSSEGFWDIVNRKDKELIEQSQVRKHTFKGDKGEKGEKGERGKRGRDARDS